MKLPSWEGSFLEECSGRRDCKGELGLEQKDFIYGEFGLHTREPIKIFI